MRLAILDPNPPRAAHYQATFSSAGYRCQAFIRTRRFLSASVRDTFDLAVVIGSPEDPALLTALDALHARQRTLQSLRLLLVLTQATDIEIAALLNRGADDCVVEPVEPALLLARTGALTRRTGVAQVADDRTVTRFDDYRFDPMRREAQFDGARIRLTPKELGLALLLFRNIGRDLSRHYLVDGVWPNDSGLASRSLDTHMSRIRHKLALLPERGYYLSAIYSHGYRLDKVSPDDGGSAAPPSGRLAA